MGKARSTYGVVRNAYRMWSENIKGHIRNLSLSGKILIHVHVRVCAHTHMHSHTLNIYQYTVNISYNEFAEVEGIRLIYQDKNVNV
jgi:hypothetical protein